MPRWGKENEALGKEYSSAMERLKASEASANAIEGQLRGKAEEVNRLAQSVEKFEAERTAYTGTNEGLRKQNKLLTDDLVSAKEKHEWTMKQLQNRCGRVAELELSLDQLREDMDHFSMKGDV